MLHYMAEPKNLEEYITHLVSESVGRALEEQLPAMIERLALPPKAAGSMTVLTTQQVANLLQVDRHVISRLVKSGQLKCKKVGNRHLFRLEWVAAFLEDDERAVTKPMSGKKRLELSGRKTAKKTD